MGFRCGGWPAALVAGGVVVGLLVAFALVAPLFGDPLHQDFARGLDARGLPVGVGGVYLLGTDALGRNQLPRLAYGARVSLTVAVVSGLASVILGAGVGVVAGYRGHATEAVLMRTTDVGLALPPTLMALVMASLMRPGVLRVIVIITALFWAYPARLVYGEVLRLRRRAFVEAAEAMGSSVAATVRRHIVPHLIPMLLAYLPLNAAAAVLFEATLSFLGAGVNPPTPSWGNMIREGQQAIAYAPHLLAEPALLIMATTGGLLLIGEGLKARNPDLARVSWLGV